MRNQAILFTLFITFSVMHNASAQDWANLKRYEKENAALSLAAAFEKRVIFMGNSITEGWLRTRPSFFEANQ